MKFLFHRKCSNILRIIFADYVSTFSVTVFVQCFECKSRFELTADLFIESVAELYAVTVCNHCVKPFFRSSQAANSDNKETTKKKNNKKEENKTTTAPLTPEQQWAQIQKEFPNVIFPVGLQLKYARLYATNPDFVGYLEAKGVAPSYDGF